MRSYACEGTCEDMRPGHDLGRITGMMIFIADAEVKKY